MKIQSLIILFSLTVQMVVSFPRRLDAAQLNSVDITVLPTKEVTVIGWIDGDPITLPFGANPILVEELNDPVTCMGLLGIWTIGIREFLVTDTDRRYANAFLIKNSANSRPPSTINPSQELAIGDFRAFNDFQVSMNANGDQVVGITKYLIHNAVAGYTPNACNPFRFPKFPPEVHVDNGARGTTHDGTGVFQMAEARVGTVGQAVSETINGHTVPWIWSVIKFDTSGNDVRIFNVGSQLNRQIFPTYSVYENGIIVATFSQSDLETFIALDEASQITRFVNDKANGVRLDI